MHAHSSILLFVSGVVFKILINVESDELFCEYCNANVLGFAGLSVLVFATSSGVDVNSGILDEVLSTALTSVLMIVVLSKMINKK